MKPLFSSLAALAFLVAALAPSVQANPPASPPTNLEGRLTAGPDGVYQVILNWTPSIGAAANETYRVYRDGTPIATTAALSAIDAVPNSIHVYQITVVNTDGESPPTAPLLLFDPCIASASRICGLLVFHPCDMILTSPTRTVCNLEEINPANIISTVNLPPEIRAILGCSLGTVSLYDHYPYVAAQVAWECIPLL